MMSAEGSQPMPDDSHGTAKPEAGRFPDTDWNLVQIAAGNSADPRAREALAQLCQTYWHPLYAFVRRQGYSPQQAHDLTQAFFAHLLEKNLLATVDRAKGRFRTFLLVALKNFLADEGQQSMAE
jgi:RNA polymerase sigma-70 factor (ECF subfamily)